MVKYFFTGLFLFWAISLPLLTIGKEENYRSQAVSSCDGITITEMMPYPSEGTEWVELHNTNDYDTNIKGCFIADIKSGTHFYEIKDDLIIQPKEYYAYYSETSLSLNNTPGDGVRIYDKDKKTKKFETHVYDTVKKGQSFAYNETVDAWQWTENLTPGNANVFDSDGNTPENGDDGGGHIYNSCDGIMITELMPSPAGPDGKNEWIELYNSNGETSDLDGCVLNDKLKAGSTKKYTFTKGMHIGSGSYLKLGRPKTKITLNNNSDGVTLMDSRGVIVFDTGLYTNAREGLSYAYHEGSWFWTETPTPGGANIITEPPAKEVKSSKKSKKKKNAKKPPKSKKKTVKKNYNKDSAVLGSNTDSEDGSTGPIDDKVMGYILVGLSAVLLVGYVVYINKDYIYENIIKKFRRDG